MKRFLICLLVPGILVMSGCGKKQQEVNTPAGHPDELKDSTRFEGRQAPDTVTSKPVQRETLKDKTQFESRRLDSVRDTAYDRAVPDSGR